MPTATHALTVSPALDEEMDSYHASTGYVEGLTRDLVRSQITGRQYVEYRGTEDAVFAFAKRIDDQLYLCTRTMVHQVVTLRDEEAGA